MSAVTALTAGCLARRHKRNLVVRPHMAVHPLLDAQRRAPRVNLLTDGAPSGVPQVRVVAVDVIRRRKIFGTRTIRARDAGRAERMHDQLKGIAMGIANLLVLILCKGRSGSAFAADSNL